MTEFMETTREERKPYMSTQLTRPPSVNVGMLVRTIVARRVRGARRPDSRHQVLVHQKAAAG